MIVSSLNINNDICHTLEVTFITQFFRKFTLRITRQEDSYL